MSNEVQIFSNELFGDVKGFLKDGEPWFLAGDVCRALGIKNSRDAVNDITKKLRAAGLKGVGTNDTLISTAGGKQKATIINEQYLYELVFNSRKQKAVLFRAWVTGEVLPALRKHGYYRMEGKMLRRAETDAIKEYIEYAKESGSDNADKYYMTITKVTNSIMGIEPAKRDSLSVEQLKQLGVIETIIDLALREGMQKKMHYKDIYKLARDKEIGRAHV